MGKLTDIQIRNWIKAGERFDMRGDGDGLYLSFRNDFAIPLWRFRYRFAGKQRVMNLGSYTTLSLADARKTSKELRARVVMGYDVAAEKQDRKKAAVAKIEDEKNTLSVGQLADEYFERMIVGHWKHPNIVRSRIERDIKPNIGKLAVKEVKPMHIDAMLQTIVKRGAPTTANDVLRWVRRMFDYAVKRHMVEYNPAVAFNVSDAGGKEEARDRWLTQGELTQLFEAMRNAKGFSDETHIDETFRDGRDRFQCAHLQCNVSRPIYLRIGRVNADQRDVQPFAKLPHCRDRHASADFDDHGAIYCLAPFMKTRPLKLGAPVHPVPIPKHEDVRAGYTAAAPAGWEWRGQDAMLFIDLRRKFGCFPDFLIAGLMALQMMD
jgi:hypothetical protein